MEILIGGVDEVGRGPLAGPVAAAAVVLPPGYENKRFVDSKQLKEHQREIIAEEIKQVALAYSIASIGPEEIDRINIREATRRAMGIAAEQVAEMLKKQNYQASLHFLVDGNVPMATNLSQETIIKGDQKVQVIAAASIIAKVARDHEMRDWDQKLPGYGFAIHKGYGTKLHKLSLLKLGPSAIHRRTFAGVCQEKSS